MRQKAVFICNNKDFFFSTYTHYLTPEYFFKGIVFGHSVVGVRVQFYELWVSVFIVLTLRSVVVKEMDPVLLHISTYHLTYLGVERIGSYTFQLFHQIH